jgi:hypothetical protein
MTHRGDSKSGVPAPGGDRKSVGRQVLWDERQTPFGVFGFGAGLGAVVGGAIGAVPGAITGSEGLLVAGLEIGVAVGALSLSACSSYLERRREARTKQRLTAARVAVQGGVSSPETPEAKPETL